jgi:hypothetical protein
MQHTVQRRNVPYRAVPRHHDAADGIPRNITPLVYAHLALQAAVPWYSEYSHGVLGVLTSVLGVLTWVLALQAAVTVSVVRCPL